METHLLPTILAERDLRECTAKHLAAYKNPVRYFFFDELPRSSTGNFDRHRLQAIVETAIAE